ncbi:PspA/IM30 family protein [Rhodococcus sp. NPDC054953]
MTDKQTIVDSMNALSDDEVRAVVAAVTTGRPALAALHAAALEIRLVPDPVGPPSSPIQPSPIPPTPQVPEPPTIIDAHVVPDPAGGTGVGAAPGVADVTGYTETGVPTFDAVREKIESRSGTADGAAELDAASGAGAALEEQYAARERAAQERLAEIRRSLRGD